MPRLVVSVFPEARDGDQVITERELALSISQHWSVQSTLPPAIIIRTLPNDKSKVGRNWSNTNPPYFDAEAMTWLVERNVDHLLVDLPSVDREVDGGAFLPTTPFGPIRTTPDTNRPLRSLFSSQKRFRTAVTC